MKYGQLETRKVEYKKNKMNEKELKQLLNINNKPSVIDYINAIVEIEIRSRILKTNKIQARKEYYSRMNIRDLKLIYNTYNHLRIINLSL